MQIFYIPDIKNDQAWMDKSESFHCIKVLRLKEGDHIQFVDGKGGFYKGIIKNPDPRKCTVNILSIIDENSKRRDYHLHIAIAPPKNQDRIEWFVEKAVEIGVDHITPLLCTHSERKKINPGRLEKKAVSAIKQSLKSILPVIDEMVSFEDFIKSDHSGFSKFIAYCDEKKNSFQRILLKDFNEKILILIGPEGDFSPMEIELAGKEGFLPVSFGESRLRTETAGVVAAQIVTDLIQIKKELQ